MYGLTRELCRKMLNKIRVSLLGMLGSKCFDTSRSYSAN